MGTSDGSRYTGLEATFSCSCFIIWAYSSEPTNTPPWDKSVPAGFLIEGMKGFDGGREGDDTVGILPALGNKPCVSLGTSGENRRRGLMGGLAGAAVIEGDIGVASEWSKTDELRYFRFGDPG